MEVERVQQMPWVQGGCKGMNVVDGYREDRYFVQGCFRSRRPRCFASGEMRGDGGIVAVLPVSAAGRTGPR